MAAFNIINYRATWDDTEETSLEAVWYGLWNRVLWDFVMHTPLPKQEFLNVHPQDALTKSPWPAEQLEGGQCNDTLVSQGIILMDKCSNWFLSRQRPTS